MDTEQVIQKLESALKEQDSGFSDHKLRVRRTNPDSVTYKLGLVCIIFLHPPDIMNEEDKEKSRKEEEIVRETTKRIAEELALKPLFEAPSYARTEYTVYGEHGGYVMFCGFHSRNRTKLGSVDAKRILEEELAFLPAK